MIKDYADKKRRAQLTRFFTLAVFFVLFCTFLLLTGTIYLLMYFDVVHIQTIKLDEWFIVLIFMVASLLLGTILTYVISRFVLKAVNKVADGMAALSKGNYDVRLDLGKNEEVKKLADAFNGLAEELQGIQMLRSNFVNEYAHEFKTPIVSIKGFAELLMNDDLSDDVKKEYLSVIIEESERLSTLSLNSLNLSKIENQRILTGQTKYNLSEQIRNSILLLEKKWLTKNIDLQINLEECYVYANEEMLKQVWINLIDNAIKYSPESSSVEINLQKSEKALEFSIKNIAIEPLTEEDKKRIFDKYYRRGKANLSGHGIGLSVVKKIVDLHEGDIKFNEKENIVVFTVELPL